MIKGCKEEGGGPKTKGRSCVSLLPWVGESGPKPEDSVVLPICESCEEEEEVGMAWQLPQCAKQNRAEREQTEG